MLRSVESLPLDVLWPFTLPPLALLRYCLDIPSLQPRSQRGCNEAVTNLHRMQFEGTGNDSGSLDYLVLPGTGRPRWRKTSHMSSQTACLALGFLSKYAG